MAVWFTLLISALMAVTLVISSPNRPSFLSQESYEVDSSEHGGEAGAKSTTCPCGWANKVNSRIVNGTATAKNEFPFAAGLAYRGTRNHFCGATIITKYHALTAAHCTKFVTADEISLIVGIYNIDKDFGGDADDIPVQQIIDHDLYNGGDLKNDDISLLVLAREIKFSPLVGPACLPQTGPRLNIDRQYVKIIGWGTVAFKSAQSDVLRKVDVKVVPLAECKIAYKIVDTKKATQMCTYANKKGSCQGDSGGPVVWVDLETNRYTHVGIVSFSRICGDISPSVHTNVQSYLDWINKKIKATKPDVVTCTKSN